MRMLPMHRTRMTLAVRLAIRGFVTAILVAVVVGVARIVEIATNVATRAFGREDATLSFLAGATATVVLVVLMTGAWLRSKRRSRGFSWTSDSGVSAAGTSFETHGSRGIDEGGPSMEEMRPFMDFVEQGNEGALRRVVGIGRSASAGEVTFELLALEIREVVARLTFVFYDPEQERREFGIRDVVRRRQPNPNDFSSLLQPRLTLSDDVGTRYQVFPSGGGGGSAGTWRGEVQFVPAPPPGATLLHVSVDRLTDQFWFGAMPGRTRPPRVIEGPWVFDVELVGGSSG
jgi:hypothetical protein